MSFTPPFTFTPSPARVISLFITPNRAAEFLLKPVVYNPMAYTQFKDLPRRYKRAGLERYYDLPSDPDTGPFETSSPTNQSKLMKTKYQVCVVDTHHDPKWVIDQWRIQFLFSERLLTTIKTRSSKPNWYEDADVALEYMAQLCICFKSIHSFHTSFGVLPVIGDRLFDEDTGLKIIDRCIDGELRTVTFVLSQ